MTMPSLNQVFLEVCKELKANSPSGCVIPDSLFTEFSLMEGMCDGHATMYRFVLTDENVLMYRNDEFMHPIQSVGFFFKNLEYYGWTYSFLRIPSYRAYAFHQLKHNFLKDRLDQLVVKHESDRVKVADVFECDESPFYEILNKHEEKILARLDARYRALHIASHWSREGNWVVHGAGGIWLYFYVLPKPYSNGAYIVNPMHKLILFRIDGNDDVGTQEKTERLRGLLDSKGLFDHEILFHDLAYIANLLDMPSLIENDPGEFNVDG